MADWPTELPALPLLPVLLGFEDGVLRSQNDVGPAQTRRVSTAMPETMRFRVVMDRTALNAFKTFWDLIQGRALPFNYHWPLTETTRSMRFTALPELRGLGRDMWEAELEVEILPDAS